ncbi:MAG TPA: alpha-glucan family phosphorylase [Bryobacteraceae bacterium]|nr:alpha-glucan family phosphorylase [Bryobacteraceae bacterium]
MDSEQLRAGLRDLALDLRWSWNHAADELWNRLDPELWALTHNAWVILQTVSQERLDTCLADAAFREKLEQTLRYYEHHNTRPHWFQTAHPDLAIKAVAYFSMEFMLSDALPIYSGGLGNVAGDQLKSASDLGVPVYGVGLLYQQGYFRQHIDADGHQEALYPYNDPTQLPISPLRQPNGEWLRVSIAVTGDVRLWLRTWEVRVGKARLFLLDSNDPANLPDFRGFTAELYGGGSETRLQQERILGIGGWRLLRALGLQPEVCHLNEGHAAFAVLERARDYMEENKQPFEVALAATRLGNLFTTHTPVEAGFDRFPPALMERRCRRYAEERLHIPFSQFMALGRLNPDDNIEPFNMAYLAIHGSGAVNGVSRLHGEVSRRLFQPLFPRWPEEELPIGYVTNGVHVPTWDSEAADHVWTAACGQDRWRGDLDEVSTALDAVPAADLWKMRTDSRRQLVAYVRTHLFRQLAGDGASADETGVAARLFDPDTLTIGFARRFATYKRPNLLLYDPDRLLRILTNPERPVQLVIAGKAHPADQQGQDMIRQWIQFIRHTAARQHAIFLADYDMQMTENLVRGVDVWLNTPRRPWEASGTSGMKVLVNGGLNLSELDGWWAEAYAPEVGWAIGDGKEHDSDPAWDRHEAEQLYALLENDVIPMFYNRDPSGIPAAWVERISESMSRLTPQFSANRVVREYVENHYVRRAKAYSERTSSSPAAVEDLVRWRKVVDEHWPRLRFGSLDVSSDGGQHLFKAQVFLDELDSAAVRVELYAEGEGGRPEVVEMRRGDPLVGAANAHSYCASVAANRPAADYTPRIVPYHPLASVPLECARILWYK